MSMILAPTSELEAVNAMLTTIGETPVNTLDGIGFTDAAIARDTLRSTSREVQSRGWYFNSDEAFPFVPAVDGRVAVAANILSLRPSLAEHRRVAPRAGFLYDRDLRTNVFPLAAPPVMDVVWFQDFGDLPETARRYITVKAARVFQTNVQGDDKIDVFTKEYEGDAFQILEREDASYFTAAAFPTGTTGTSELEAVNAILVGSLEQPVTILRGNDTSPSSVVWSLLRSVSRDLQTTGWYFNTTEAYTWPLSNGKAAITADVLGVLPALDETRRLSPVAGFLVNRDTGSSTFDPAKPPITKVIRFLDFSLLPESARRVIIATAGNAFQDTRTDVVSDAQGNSQRKGRLFTPERVEATQKALFNEQIQFYGRADNIDTLEATAEQEAINSILMAFGLESSTEIGPGLTAANAVRTSLRDASRALQARGWYFNREDDAYLTVDVDGRIAIPADVLKLRPSDLQETRVVPKGKFLWDATNRTDVFEDGAYITVTRFVPFDELSELARRWIVNSAGLMFQASPYALAYAQEVRGAGNAPDTGKSGASALVFTEVTLRNAEAALIREEQSFEEPANMFNDASDVSEVFTR